jgi:hypothetical protein
VSKGRGGDVGKRRGGGAGKGRDTQRNLGLTTYTPFTSVHEVQLQHYYTLMNEILHA